MTTKRDQVHLAVLCPQRHPIADTRLIFGPRRLVIIADCNFCHHTYSAAVDRTDSGCGCSKTAHMPTTADGNKSVGPNASQPIPGSPTPAKP